MAETSSLGRVIVDPSGKKPVRVGQNIEGFDLLSVIEQLKEASLASVKKYSDSVEKNKTVVVPAITALQAEAQLLHDDAVSLSNYLGALATTSNTLKDLQYTVIKSGEYSQAAYVDVTVDNTVAKATTNAISIKIQRLASIDSRTTDNAILTTGVVDNTLSAVTSVTSALNITGNIYINGTTIAITATDNLNSIVSAINSSAAGVQANIVPTGSHFNLILNGTVLATPLTFTGPLSETSAILSTNFGIDTTTPTVIENLQSHISYVVNDGVRGEVNQTYIGNSNTIVGLIPGVTLKLLGTTLNSGGTYDNLSISLSENTKGTLDKIVDFIERYNSIRKTLNGNLPDAEGNPLDSKASMARSPLVRRLIEQLDDIASFTLSGATGSDYRAWQDIGIIKEETLGIQNGTFKVPDVKKLSSAIVNDFAKVKKLFGNTSTVTNSDFRVWDIGSLDNSIAGQPITVTFSKVADLYYARFVCGTVNTGAILQTGQYRFIGPAGSVFENITIGYQGTELANGNSKTFTLTATQGVADRIAKKLDNTLDKDNGDFATEIKRTQQQNEKSKDKITRAEKETERIEKKWMSKNTRLIAARQNYEQFSRQLDNMFSKN